MWNGIQHYQHLPQCLRQNDEEHTFLTPPVAGALFLAALVASCLRGALPPVDLRAVCLVRAMLADVAKEVVKALYEC